jgi:hypothetical protein
MRAGGGAPDPDPAPVAHLAWDVRAVVDGDWIVFLDLAGNRYRASPLSSAPPIACMRPLPIEWEGLDDWQALARHGLVSQPPRRGRDQIGAEAPLTFKCAGTLLDLIRMVRAAFWAHDIVRRGALSEAFGVLSGRKRALGAGSLERAAVVHAKFARARIWVPRAYVCLFDSLCLMRFLLACGVAAELVFGVRGRPFAAHCWVESEGVILDDGGEACRSFVEIARL